MFTSITESGSFDLLILNSRYWTKIHVNPMYVAQHNKPTEHQSEPRHSHKVLQKIQRMSYVLMPVCEHQMSGAFFQNKPIVKLAGWHSDSGLVTEGAVHKCVSLCQRHAVGLAIAVSINGLSRNKFSAGLGSCGLNGFTRSV